MKINLKSGIDVLLFGMKEKDVTALYGEPDRKYKDDEKNSIFLYNDKKLRLTFYADEDFRLGYIIASHPALELFSTTLIGKKWAEIAAVAQNNNLKYFEEETFDSVVNYFNEANWLILQAEFDEIIRVELGAIINSKDEFDWKFKS
ncbi:hypothetical protein ACLI09_10040 [Flavobacterium sp. RHBU_24]|uniref:hypothetical protein n=1 Tax=Flavobacterium sp. RHBU_24 TaxID=3391185 RepID=UPI0039847577